MAPEPDMGHFSLEQAALILCRKKETVRKMMDKLGIEPTWARLSGKGRAHVMIAAKDVEALTALVPRHKPELKVAKEVHVMIETSTIPDDIKVDLLEIQRMARTQAGRKMSLGLILFNLGVLYMAEHGQAMIREVVGGGKPWERWKYRPDEGPKHRAAITPRMRWPRPVEVPEWAKERGIV